MIFSNSVLYQTASFHLGFAFINKTFHISNQSLFSEKAIPPPLLLLPPSCLSTLPQSFQPMGLAQKRNDWKHRVYNALLVLGLLSPQGAYHAPENVGNSTQITVSGNRVLGSLPVAPDNCSDRNGLNCINNICVLDSWVDDNGGAACIYPSRSHSPIGAHILGDW